MPGVLLGYEITLPLAMKIMWGFTGRLGGAVLAVEHRSVHFEVPLHFDGPDPAVALRVACDISEALSYLESQGFIHRDISPTNVIVPDDPDRRARAALRASSI